MAVTHPELAAEWHPAKNGDLTPFDVVAGTRRKLWWICSANPEHEWEATGDNRVRAGSGCPSCGTYGFKPSEEAWLYLLEQPTWQLQQVGITNEPEVRLAEESDE
jgi:hypothetical protein